MPRRLPCPARRRPACLLLACLVAIAALTVPGPAAHADDATPAAPVAAAPAAEAKPAYSADQFGYVRLFRRATLDPKWAGARSLADRLWLVRSYALKEKIASNPVSDRYLITCYGGPIDLVHFLGIAVEVANGKPADARVFQEWQAEGGRENLMGYNHREPPEAHPDDLPSNAFGALFGTELQAHLRDMDRDLMADFTAFVAPLIPVPDPVARTFSHGRIVMGLADTATLEEMQARGAWFTAAPLVQTALINAAATRILKAPLCADKADGEAALAAAGFRLVKVEGQPIAIRRADSYY